MRAKTLILLFVALGCGMIAAVAVSKAVMDKSPGETAEPTTEIFVAVKKLIRGEQITPESVRLEKWPNKRLPEEALTNLEQLEGWFPKMDIFPGEPIILGKIQEENDSMAGTIPTGMRLFDIPCNKAYVKAGDHVDVVGTFSGGRSGSRNAGPPQTQTVMRRVKVHGINGSAVRETEEADKPKGGKNLVFQLLVKQSQVEALSLANTMGKLDLILRPAGEEDVEFEDNGEAFLSWIEGQTEEEPEPEPTLVASGFPPPVAPAPAKEEEEEENEMIIITPTGVKTYVWKGNELPQEKKPEIDETAVESTSPQYPGYAYGASGNVYSNYGGYEPTYPTSVNPSAPEAGTPVVPGQTPETPPSVN